MIFIALVSRRRRDRKFWWESGIRRKKTRKKNRASLVTTDLNRLPALSRHINNNNNNSYNNNNNVDQTISSFTFVVDATLLGAPLFAGKVLDDTCSARCEDLKLAVDRLSLLSAQDALLLLRVSFSAPRVQYLLRCMCALSGQSRA